MPLGKLRTGPREYPAPISIAGSSKICRLPSTEAPQRWDNAGHEVDSSAMDVDGESCVHSTGASELLSYTESLTLSHSLASTRQRHLTSILPRVFTHTKVNKIRIRPFAAAEYFPSTSFHSVNPEPVKGKGKQKAANQDAAVPTQATLTDGPPAHELSCIGWCGLQIGPMEYEGVSIWIGKFVRDRPGDSINVDAQRRERERKERERKEKERQAQAQAAAKRQQANAQSLKPADIPLTLIQKVNQAASQNPWLATLIHKAAKHEATKDELTRLGKVVSTLQAQLATEAAKAKTEPVHSATPVTVVGSSTPKPTTGSSATNGTEKAIAVDSAATKPTPATPAPVGAVPSSSAVSTAPKNAPTPPFAPPFAAKPVTSTIASHPQSTPTIPKPAISQYPQYVPHRPQSLPDLPSIPFIVISFRDNPSDKFLLPLGTQAFMSRIPISPLTTTTRANKRKTRLPTSFPTLELEEANISAELEHDWEDPPAPGTVLISYMVPCAGWRSPNWPAKPRPGAAQGPQPSSNAPFTPGPSTLAKPTPSPAPVPQPAPPVVLGNSVATSTTARPNETASAPPVLLVEGASTSRTVATASKDDSSVAAAKSAESATATSTVSTPATPASASAVIAETPLAAAGSTGVPPQPAASKGQVAASVPTPTAPIQRPSVPVYPPLIRLATASLIPEKGAVRPITIRLTGVTDVTWRAMQDLVRVVEFDEVGDLALDDPMPVRPSAQASPASAIANTEALSATEKLTRAAEEERRKEEEMRLAKLNAEYDVKVAAREAKIVARYEKKATTFRKLMERVPARSFLKHRLGQVLPELVEAETDKFGPRLYNIYPRSRFGLPPPAYRSTMDDTTQLELDLEEPSAAAAAPNPRKRKAEPAVAFEVPMSFDGIDEAVAEQARKSLLKGQGGGKRRKSEGGEDTKRKVGKRSVAGSICEGCGSAKFRVWRKGPGGKATLCKNCGDKFNAGTLGPLVAPGAAKLKVEPAETNANGTTPSAPEAVAMLPGATAAPNSVLGATKPAPQPSSSAQPGPNLAIPSSDPSALPTAQTVDEREAATASGAPNSVNSLQTVALVPPTSASLASEGTVPSAASTVQTTNTSDKVSLSDAPALNSLTHKSSLLGGNAEASTAGASRTDQRAP